MSDNDEYIKLLLLLLLKRRHQNNTKPKQNRRWWVRPINRDREKKGEFKRLMIEMRLHDTEWFFTYTRMTPSLFDDLLRLVSPKLIKRSIRKPLSPSQRLAITLRYLSTGDSTFSIANSYQIGRSTVCTVVNEVLQVIWDVLSPIVLIPPNEQKFKEIAEEFENRWNMPLCAGSIDGKHIEILAPANSGSLFHNYKNYFSIILLGICDGNYNFMYIDVGAYGSLSDGGVFSSSLFGQNLLKQKLPLPPPAFLNNSDITMPYYFVGDAAFPLKENLMRPYAGRNLCIIKAVFNYRLSRARRVIENTFGILVARWRIFLRTINATPDKTDNIVKATVCLHNFIRKSKPAREKYCPTNYIDSDDVLGRWRIEVKNCQLQSVTQLGTNNATKSAMIFRDNLAKYFLSKAGFKKGQIEYIKRV